MEVLLTGLCQGEIPDSRVVVLYVPVVTETKVRDRLRGNRFPVVMIVLKKENGCGSECRTVERRDLWSRRKFHRHFVASPHYST